jgi:prepilin-type N-terminal cleavage/methylation domain-containing protein
MFGRRCHCAHRGFTLIELLVVIAILAIVAAILFPVFTSAFAMARNTACQSNLKQLYVAFQMYAADWDDTLPCPGGLVGDAPYWLQEAGGGIDQYLKNLGTDYKSVFCCPCYPTTYGSRWLPCTYGMNSYLRDPADIPYPACLNCLSGIRTEMICVASQTILLYEGIQADKGNALGEGYVYRCGDWQQVRGYYKKLGHRHGWKDGERSTHAVRNNYLLCDGHILAMKPEVYPDFRGPTKPSNNLWYAEHQRD